MMEKVTNWVQKRQLLRAEAEAMIASFSAPNATAQTWDLLCHELMVHKVELEMQVEELRRANFEMQDLAALYESRYELGPAASFSVDSRGLISHVNAAGARLLGFDREQLVNHPFAKFIARLPDADRWHLLHRQRVQQPDTAHPPFVLDMGRADGQALQAFCSTSMLPREGFPSELQLVLVDLAELQPAQTRLSMQNAP